MDISSSTAKPTPIRDQKIHGIEQQQGKGPRGVRGRQAADEIALSEQAQLLTKLSKAVQDSPDVREEKVAALREAVKKQQYEISYSEIAKAILASRGNER